MPAPSYPLPSAGPSQHQGGDRRLEGSRVPQKRPHASSSGPRRAESTSSEEPIEPIEISSGSDNDEEISYSYSRVAGETYRAPRHKVSSPLFNLGTQRGRPSLSSSFSKAASSINHGVKTQHGQFTPQLTPISPDWPTSSLPSRTGTPSAGPSRSRLSSSSAAPPRYQLNSNDPQESPFMSRLSSAEPEPVPVLSSDKKRTKKKRRAEDGQGQNKTQPERETTDDQLESPSASTDSSSSGARSQETAITVLKSVYDDAAHKAEQLDAALLELQVEKDDCAKANAEAAELKADLARVNGELNASKVKAQEDARVRLESSNQLSAVEKERDAANLEIARLKADAAEFAAKELASHAKAGRELCAAALARTRQRHAEEEADKARTAKEESDKALALKEGELSALKAGHVKEAGKARTAQEAFDDALALKDEELSTLKADHAKAVREKQEELDRERKVAEEKEQGLASKDKAISTLKAKHAKALKEEQEDLNRERKVVEQKEQALAVKDEEISTLKAGHVKALKETQDALERERKAADDQLSKLQLVTANRDLLRQQVETLEASVSANAQASQQLESERDQLRIDLASNEKELSVVRTKCGRLEQGVVSLQESATAKAKAHDLLKVDRNKVATQLADLRETSKTHKSECNRLSKANAALRDSASANASALSQVETERNVLRANLASARETLNLRTSDCSRLQDELDALQESLSSKDTECRQLATENERWRAEIALAVSASNSAVAERDELREEKDRWQSIDAQKEQRTSELDSQLEPLSAKLKELTAKLGVLQSERDEDQQEASKLRTDLTATTQECASLRTEATDAAEASKLVRAELYVALFTISTLRDQLKSANASDREASARASDSQSTLEYLRSSTRTSALSAEKEIATLCEQLAFEKAKQVSTNNANQAVGTVGSSSISAETELMVLWERLADVNARLARTEKARDEAEVDASLYATDLGDARARVDELDSIVQAAHAELVSLRQQVVDLSAAVSTAESERDEAQATTVQADTLRRQCVAELIDFNELKASCAATENARDEALSKITDLESDIASTREQLQLAAADRDSLKNELGLSQKGKAESDKARHKLESDRDEWKTLANGHARTLEQEQERKKVSDAAKARELREKSAKLSKSEKARIGLEHERDLARTERAKAENERDAAQAKQDLQRADILAKDKALMKIKEERNTALIERDRFRSDLAAEKETTKKVEKERDGARLQRDQSQLAHSVANSALNDAQAMITSLEEAVSGATSRITALESERDALKQSEVDLTSRISSLEKKLKARDKHAKCIQAHKALHDKMTRSISDLQEKLDLQTAISAAVQHQQEDVVARCEVLRSATLQADIDLDAYRRQVESLRSQIAQRPALAIQIEGKLRELDEAEKQMAEITVTIDTLVGQYDAVMWTDGLDEKTRVDLERQLDAARAVQAALRARILHLDSCVGEVLLGQRRRLFELQVEVADVRRELATRDNRVQIGLPTAHGGHASTSEKTVTTKEDGGQATKDGQCTKCRRRNVMDNWFGNASSTPPTLQKAVSDVTLLLEENETLKEQVLKLERQVECYADELCLKQEQLDELASSRLRPSREGELEGEIRKLVATVSTLRIEVAALQGKLLEKDKDLRAKDEEFGKTVTVLAKTEEELEKTATRLKETATEQENTRAEFDSQTQQLNIRLSESIVALRTAESTAAASEDEVKGLRYELEVIAEKQKQETVKLQDIIFDLRGQLRTLATECGYAKNATPEQTVNAVAHLTQQVHRLKQQVYDREMALTKALEKLGRRDATIAKLKKPATVSGDNPEEGDQTTTQELAGAKVVLDKLCYLLGEVQADGSRKLIGYEQITARTKELVNLYVSQTETLRRAYALYETLFKEHQCAVALFRQKDERVTELESQERQLPEELEAQDQELRDAKADLQLARRASEIQRTAGAQLHQNEKALREERISSLVAAVTRLQEAVTRITAERDDLQREVQRATEVVQQATAQHNDQLKNWMAELEERDHRIAEKDQRIGEQEQCLAEKEASMDEQAKVLKERDEDIKRREEQLAQKVSALEVKDRRIIDRDGSIAVSEAQIKQLETQLAKLQADVERLTTDLLGERDQIEELEKNSIVLNETIDLKKQELSTAEDMLEEERRKAKRLQLKVEHYQRARA